MYFSLFKKKNQNSKPKLLEKEYSLYIARFISLN